MENEHWPSSEVQAGSQSPSPTSPGILGLVDQDQILPTNNTFFPPRASSLRPPIRMSSLPGAELYREEPDYQEAKQTQRTYSLKPPRTSSFAGAGQDRKEPDQQEATVEQTQLLRMFQTSKQKIVGLLSPKQTPPRHPDHPNTPNNSPDHFFDERASLTPIPGCKNKFWLTGGLPSQKSKDRAERRMLRRMSPRSRERRSVTAENRKKAAELEEERVDVRDFQLEHDRAKEREREVEAVALEGVGEEADAQK